MAQSRRSGVALSVMDGFFAATALAKDLTLVTRNVKDFTSFGVPLFNPCDEHAKGLADRTQRASASRPTPDVPARMLFDP
jgi:hypothetical protein